MRWQRWRGAAVCRMRPQPPKGGSSGPLDTDVRPQDTGCRPPAPQSVPATVPSPAAVGPGWGDSAAGPGSGCRQPQAELPHAHAAPGSSSEGSVLQGWSPSHDPLPACPALTRCLLAACTLPALCLAPGYRTSSQRAAREGAQGLSGVHFTLHAFTDSLF